MHTPPCRLKRLGRGEKELARSDFQMIPELAGNPFLPRIFEMYDTDGDGYMGAADLRALLESLTRLANEEERYQCGWPGVGRARVWHCGVACWKGLVVMTKRHVQSSGCLRVLAARLCVCLGGEVGRRLGGAVMCAGAMSVPQHRERWQQPFEKQLKASWGWLLAPCCPRCPPLPLLQLLPSPGPPPAHLLPALTLLCPPGLPACTSAARPYTVAFRIYDADDDGFVSRADLLRHLAATNRRGLSEAQLEQIMAHTVAAFDADGDGKLCYQEFRALLSASSTERNKALNF